MGVTARSLRGPVWWGGAEELTVSGIRLGTLNVFLDPLPLFHRPGPDRPDPRQTASPTTSSAASSSVPARSVSTA